MRSLLRRSATPVALTLALAAAGAACSSTTTNTTPGTTPGGSNGTAGSGTTSNFDYAGISATIGGSGATFPANFYEAVIESMTEVAPDLENSYGGGGSGKGKTDLQEQLVNYAGTDSLVKDEDKPKYKGGTILYFPTVAAPITVSYNVSGVDKLNLSQATLANIFQGKISKWNDAAIKADNASANLPDKNIVVVHRADGSGTTNNFTSYLKAATPDWTLGSGDTVQWPSGQQQGQGNGGVAQSIKATDGSIGYVDFADAKASNFTFASIKNKAGTFVAPSLPATSAALAKAKVNPDLTYNALDTDGADVYPIVAGTYIIVYQKQTDASKGNAVKGFLTYILNEGQGQAEGVNYAKLPDDLKSKAIAQLGQLQVG